MYDHIVCRYPLPTVPPAWATPDYQYQTKSLGCRMDLYEIRDDGTLWIEEYDTEDHSERAKWKAEHPNEELPQELADNPLSGFVGCMSRVNKRWVQQRFHGVLEFYHSNWSSMSYGMTFTPDGCDHEGVTYEATFVDGILTTIVETECTREASLSSDIYHSLENMFQEDTPEIDKSEPEIGAEMYVLWGSINRDLSRGYPVRLIAKTAKDWAFEGHHNKIETIDPHQLGNCLFHSKADAEAQRTWEFQVWDRKTEYCKQLIQSNQAALTNA